MCHTQKLPQDIRATQYRHSLLCVSVCVLMWSVGNFNEFTCVMRRVVCRRRRRVSCVSHVLPHCSCPSLLHTHTLSACCCPFVCRLLVLIVLIFYTKLLVFAYMQQLQKLLFLFSFLYVSFLSLSNRNFCSLTEYIVVVVVVVVLLLCSSIANWVNKFVTDTHN